MPNVSGGLVWKEYLRKSGDLDWENEKNIQENLGPRLGRMRRISKKIWESRLGRMRKILKSGDLDWKNPRKSGNSTGKNEKNIQENLGISTGKNEKNIQENLGISTGKNEKISKKIWGPRLGRMRRISKKIWESRLGRMRRISKKIWESRLGRKNPRKSGISTGKKKSKKIWESRLGRIEEHRSHLKLQRPTFKMFQVFHFRLTGVSLCYISLLGECQSIKFLETFSPPPPLPNHSNCISFCYSIIFFEYFNPDSRTISISPQSLRLISEQNLPFSFTEDKARIVKSVCNKRPGIAGIEGRAKHISPCLPLDRRSMSYLVFPLEDQNIGDSAEGDAQMDNLSLSDLIGNVPDVNHSGRFEIRLLSV
ncbi:hypothetical protein WDU94_005317 [Cyamophila willieti]